MLGITLGVEFLFFLKFVLCCTEMKFTLKNIGALGFCFQMHQREMSALKVLTNSISVVLWLLVEVFGVKLINFF